MRITLKSAKNVRGSSGARWKDSRDEAGVALIECLVYFALLFVIIELAFTAYDRMQVSSQRLSKNTEDIVASLHAGERWREDIRQATNEPAIQNETIHIQQASGEVVYAFRENAILRRGGANPQWTRLLSSVKSSQMIKDADANVTSWRWELELKAREKSPRIHPAFTFQAVAVAHPK